MIFYLNEGGSMATITVISVIIEHHSLLRSTVLQDVPKLFRFFQVTLDFWPNGLFHLRVHRAI